MDGPLDLFFLKMKSNLPYRVSLARLVCLCARIHNNFLGLCSQIITAGLVIKLNYLVQSFLSENPLLRVFFCSTHTVAFLVIATNHSLAKAGRRAESVGRADWQIKRTEG